MTMHSGSVIISTTCPYYSLNENLPSALHIITAPLNVLLLLLLLFALIRDMLGPWEKKHQSKLLKDHNGRENSENVASER